jgi:hypothetical protein
MAEAEERDAAQRQAAYERRSGSAGAGSRDGYGMVDDGGEWAPGASGGERKRGKRPKIGSLSEMVGAGAGRCVQKDSADSAATHHPGCSLAPGAPEA